MIVYLGLTNNTADQEAPFEYALSSAALAWTRTGLRTRPLHPEVREIFLDSGGFSVWQKGGTYPWTLDQYVAWVERMKIRHPSTRYAAVRDYPFDPEKTTRSAAGMIDLPLEGVAWVHVLQGDRPADYLRAVDLAKDAGVITPLTAIGCLKGRPPGDVDRIVSLVREALPPNIEIHCFGLGLRFLSSPTILSAARSVDTSSWMIGQIPGKKFPSTKDERIRSLVTYREKVDRLCSRQDRQTTIAEFAE